MPPTRRATAPAPDEGLPVAGTKTSRHSLIKSLISSRPVKSQGELARLLAEKGISVTQTTLSRDLVELDATKIRGPEGSLIYAVPSEGFDRTPQAAVSKEVLDARLAKACQDLLVTAEASANLVVLKTPPGAAQYLASSIDHSTFPQVMGTIAGDDTILLICRDPQGGEAVARRFLTIAAEHA